MKRMDIYILSLSDGYYDVLGKSGVAEQAGLDEIKNTGDFDILQKSLKNPDQYAYGDAWENTYVYNSLSQFVISGVAIISTGLIRKPKMQPDI